MHDAGELPGPDPELGFDPRAEVAHLCGTAGWERLYELTATGGWWRRDHLGGHVTVGALLVDPVGRAMACVLHPKFGRWMQPGGHVEVGDASLRHGAARELWEECGVTVEPGQGRVVQLAAFDGIPCPRGASTTHLDVRVAWLSERCDLVCSPESLEVAWLSLDDLPGPHDEDLVQLAALAARLCDEA